MFVRSVEKIMPFHSSDECFLAKHPSSFFGMCNSEVIARFTGNILGLNSYSIECAQSLLLSPGTASTMAHP